MNCKFMRVARSGPSGFVGGSLVPKEQPIIARRLNGGSADKKWASPSGTAELSAVHNEGSAGHRPGTIRACSQRAETVLGATAWHYICKLKEI